MKAEANNQIMDTLLVKHFVMHNFNFTTAQAAAGVYIF